MDVTQASKLLLSFINAILSVFYRKGRYLNSDRLFAMYTVTFNGAKRYNYWKRSV